MPTSASANAMIMTCSSSAGVLPEPLLDLSSVLDGKARARSARRRDHRGLRRGHAGLRVAARGGGPPARTPPDPAIADEHSTARGAPAKPQWFPGADAPGAD